MTPQFQPGFRLSLFDVGVLVGGTVAACVAWQSLWWVGFGIAFVVIHFFLFCNVFRIARVPELIWAVAFAGMSATTILFEMPGWIGTIVASLLLSSVLIISEIRHPGYHGVAWQRWNPDLPQWWESYLARKSSASS